MIEEIKEFKDFKYKVDNNEVTIITYLGEDENLKIPRKIRGKKVTSIEARAIWFSKELRYLTIPDTVNNLEGLKSSYNLVSIKVDENNKNYTDKDGVLFTKDEKVLITYPRKKKGFSYVIPDTVTRIEKCAFSNCRLRKIIIPSGVTSIEKFAFSDSKLKEITISDTVMNIGREVFSSCENLLDIKVDKNNKNYADKDGVLLTKDEKVLIKYPIGRMESVYTIPDTVTSIGEWAFSESKLMFIENLDKVTKIGENAFSNCGNLRYVELSELLKVIESWVFYGCANLMNITIPESVTTIKDNAFGCCFSFTSIKIPDSVTNIEYDAFHTCLNLRNIEIPQSVKSIGNNAFTDCDKMIVYGEENSYVETYAKENSIPFKPIKKIVAHIA